MYYDVKSCVAVGKDISPFFKSYCGVQQGENLSPILFPIYLNDPESYLERIESGVKLKNHHNGVDVFLKLFVLLYADDTVLFSYIPIQFQNLLNRFNEYCSQWRLKINMSKTKVVMFGTNKPQNFKFYINGYETEVVREYKYLGIVFSSTVVL